METISQRIKRLRIEKNMSQGELAEKTGYSDKSAICRVESGKHDIPQSKLVAIAKALGVSIDYLLDGEEKSLEVEFYSMSKDAQEQFLKRVGAYFELIQKHNSSQYPYTIQVTEGEYRLIQELRQKRAVDPAELEEMFNTILRHKSDNDTLTNPIDCDDKMYYQIRVKQFLDK